MAWRQQSGSVVCPSCGRLVGVRDEQCFSCGRRNPGMYGFAPVLRRFGRDLGFVPLITTLCVVFYGLSLVVDPQGVSVMSFPFLAPSVPAGVLFGASGAYPLFGLDRWWTVLSAGWLHGGILHIMLNLMAFRQVAPVIAEIYGPGRLMILWVVSSAGGFLLTSLVAAFVPFLPHFLAGADLTLGASAALFGLIGAELYASQRGLTGSIGGQMWSWAASMVVFGLISGGRIDNWAHVGGMATGYLVGRLLDPRVPERGDHVAIGLALMLVSLLAVVVSVLTLVF